MTTIDTLNIFLVKYISAENLTLRGVQTYEQDSYILVNAQTDPVENGVYQIKNSSWIRDIFKDGDTLISYVIMAEVGTDQYFVENGGLVGTDPINFTKGEIRNNEVIMKRRRNRILTLNNSLQIKDSIGKITVVDSSLGPGETGTVTLNGTIIDPANVVNVFVNSYSGLGIPLIEVSSVGQNQIIIKVRNIGSDPLSGTLRLGFVIS
jgi:hypothetical protein